MLKNNALNRIIMASLALIIFLIIYKFPTINKTNVNNETNYIKVDTKPIYLIDQNNYVARINILNNNDDQIKGMINLLTINNPSSIYLPEGFKAIIPENTKLNSYSLDKGLLKLDFSKEFLNVSKDDSENLITSLVYSLTELNNVDKIMIFIEGVKLLKIPNTDKLLPNELDRSIGINKVYDISSLKDIKETTTYYIAKYNDLIYYVPVSSFSNNDNEKIQIIIKNLKTSPINQTNLMSYLASSVNIENYEILENSINLSFNDKILASINDDKLIEEVKYSLYLSLKDTYNIKAVVFELPNSQESIYYE